MHNLNFNQATINLFQFLPIWCIRQCFTFGSSSVDEIFLLDFSYNQGDQIGNFLKVLGYICLLNRHMKCMVTSWTNLKNTTVLPSKNSCGYFLGNLLNDLGYSLLQHLATMIIILLSKLDVVRNIFIADQQILLKQNNVSDALMYFKPLFSLFWFIDTLTEAESWFSN